MAAPPSPSADYFAGRQTARTRPPPTVLPERQRTGGGPGTPGSPRTPVLGRSISSQFASPGSYRGEQEDTVVYELGARHISAGFAGESRPRCILRFHPDMGRRVGEYRQYDPQYTSSRRGSTKRNAWGDGYELYRTDCRGLDLGLVHDKLERAVRTVHADFLQLDQKPRKAVLAVPSLLPTPLLEVALRILFNHYAQPPSVQILSTPILACVGAGLRNALVIELGWEEIVITAVGEYREVFQRRSVRAGKRLSEITALMLQDEVKKANPGEEGKVDFAHAEDVVERLGWCKPQPQQSSANEKETIKQIPLPDGQSTSMAVPFSRLSEPAEDLFFTASDLQDLDDNDLPLHVLAYRVLLALPLDLRALCISRIVLTGGLGSFPGLRSRLLCELNELVGKRGWDPVAKYGSATAWHERTLRERSANIAAARQAGTDGESSANPTKQAAPDFVPARHRKHDDIKDHVTLKSERNHGARPQDIIVKGVVRGVETLGPWAGASMVASLRIKGVREVEREDFLKHGLKDGAAVY
ncbi:hypothetical protein BAUCODRAFT_61872 [Baudoinia panamericana UAMH 10762]|uniref:Actin-like ATPase domain-containing protein n=1 Tax=Baudoinia panamericana (strain UAMH 10762) TaxID=717646 RepID=M2N992_BAUPA|nr:uncharacterized protein BAUCODRAFT_61872 [Baudoinia panamericana UAMH 10762]EMD00739.1 hypothetical protein BAUCODRAFT_61872 [Baudoinia panamericana UAMH 10762]